MEKPPIVLDVYEAIGVLIPGSILLIGYGFFFDVPALNWLVSPQTFGSLVVHIILGYTLGQLIQTVSKFFETIYWHFFRGQPTDQIIAGANPNREAIELLCYINEVDASELREVASLERKKDKPKDDRKDKAEKYNSAKWRDIVSRTISRINATDKAGRLKIFNAHYAMFRGLGATQLILVVSILLLHGRIKPDIDLVISTVACSVLLVLTTIRFHRFATLYCKELLNLSYMYRQSQQIAPQHK